MDNQDSRTPSAISYVDYGDWHIGQEVMTVLLDRPGGRQVAIGHIHLDYDENAKKSSYRSYDANGKEIYAANYSLAQVKKQFKRHEDHFIAEVENQESLRRHGDTIEKLSDDLDAAGTGNIKTPRVPVPSPYASEVEKKDRSRDKGLKNLRGKNRTKQRSRGR